MGGMARSNTIRRVSDQGSSCSNRRSQTSQNLSQLLGSANLCRKQTLKSALLGSREDSDSLNLTSEDNDESNEKKSEPSQVQHRKKPEKKQKPLTIQQIISLTLF
jgi:hypothetical protein